MKRRPIHPANARPTEISAQRGPWLRRQLHWLSHALIEPKSATEDERRREYILNIILVGSIFALLLLDAVVLYYLMLLGSHDHGIPFVAFSMIPAFFIFLLALSRRGQFVLASYLLVAAYFLCDSYAVIRWTADMPPALIGYALIIMIASVLLGNRFGFVTTGVIGAFLIPIGYLQLHAVIVSDASWKQNPNDTDTLVFVVLFVLVMTIAWLSNRETEKSLTRARMSERDLQHERDFLEVKVKERTQELQKAQFEKIEQINQFAEFGQLASGLFHDMLNIMNALSLRTDIAATDSAGQPIGGRASQNASATTRQIEQFVSAIRKQLNRQESEELFSVKESVEQVIQLLSYKAHRERVRIIFTYDEEGSALTYWGNPFKFHQVIFNLILNGIESYEAMARGPVEERSVTVNVGKREGDAVMRVEDHGCGIGPDIQEKIFEPFFSTKTGTKGMGIGLASVKKLVDEDFAGIISVHSEVGKGSVFTVTLPLKQE